MTLENVDDIYPLSPLQKGMLYHSLSARNTGVFIQQIVLTIEGDLRSDHLALAWDRLVSAHPVLRTAFLWDGLDEPLQVVRTNVTTPWSVDDWRSFSVPRQEEAWEALLTKDCATDFDLARAPLSRMKIVRFGDRLWKWVWTNHHLQCDGWSTHLLLRQLWKNYRQCFTGETSSDAAAARPSLFRDYISWLKQQDPQIAQRFWREQLAGFVEPANPQLIPVDVSGNTDNPTNQLSGRSHCQQSLTLSTKHSSRLREFARQNRLTLNTVTQGAWGILLSRYSGKDDVVFGVTVSSRPTDLKGIDEAVGLYINTMPARFRTDVDLDIVEWLTNLQSTQRKQREFAYAALPDVMRCSDIPAGEALFDTLFVFENYPADQTADQVSDLAVLDVEILERSNYPLAILVVPDDDIRLIAVHDRKEYPRAAVLRLLKQMEHILIQFPQHPEQSPSSFSIATEAERLTVLNEWNHSLPDPPSECLHELIEHQAARSPASVAVRFRSESRTYGELNSQADVIAEGLIQEGIRSGDHVALLTERSVDMLTGVLAILKTGAAYVPISLDWPADQLKSALTEAEVTVAVAQQSLVPRLPPETRAVLLDQRQETADCRRVTSPGSRQALAAGSPAYIIFTSGSTGRPKGVAVSHSSIVASTQARSDFYPQSPKRFLLLSPLSFDSSVAGIFWTLCTGGTVILPGPQGERNAHELAELIVRHSVTHLLCLPTLYEVLLDEEDPTQLTSLQSVIVAGEACPRRLPHKHRRSVPAARLYNEYGPTETTVWCTAMEIGNTPDHQVPPIGRPISCARAYVLDQHRHVLPAGASGELFIGGLGVSLGYVNQPQRTAERFSPDPYIARGRMYQTGDLACFTPDGTLLFLGRMDRQVKIRGHRVEPGAIEHALKSHPSVREAAVFAVSEFPEHITCDRAELSCRLSELPDEVALNLINKVKFSHDVDPQSLSVEVDR